MENQDYIQQLLHKYLNNTASEEEQKILFDALYHSPDNQHWENWLLPVFEQQQAADPISYQPATWEPVIQHIITPKVAAAKVKRLPVFVRMATAAAIIAVMGAGAFYLYNSQALHHTTTVAKDDIPPVSNKAMLTLADGRVVALDSATAGILATQGNSSIQKGSGNALTYSTNNQPQGNVLQYNTLSTPKGGQFQLVLPDGTKVWLNAASNIRYPVSFAANNRKVELQGEAYFEVKQNAAAPFIIHSAQQDITVLGTSFNVNAYTEEGFTKTTLIDGKVQIAMPNAAGYILTPGQQLHVQSNGVSLNNNADVQQAIAWKDGQLSMNNLDVKALMRLISRWYDVEVIYEGTPPQRRFGGFLDHKVYLSNLTEVLQSQGIVCRLEGKQLHISSP